MQVHVLSPGGETNTIFLTCSGKDLIFVVRLALLVIGSLYIQNGG